VKMETWLVNKMDDEYGLLGSKKDLELVLVQV